MNQFDDVSIRRHAELFRLDPHIAAILHSRGLKTPAQIDVFLNPMLSDMHGPFQMDGMRPAVERIRRAVNSGEKIGIFADSDLDGITSLAILHTFFTRINVDPYLRYLTGEESYGMTVEIVNDCVRAGVKLLITVDSGTRDVSEIAYARGQGLDIIVTDHHEEDIELPDAILVNPRLSGCPYPFKELAGVGVAFKLCHALLLSYLPSFNRSFLIIHGSDDGHSAALVRDFSVERLDRSLTGPDVERAIASLADNSLILVHGNCVFSGCPLPQGVVFADFTQFVAGIVQSSSATFAGICMHLSIDTTIHITDIETLVRIFLEAQMVGSDKIRSFIDSVIGLVSIGSIADVVSLTGENRVLVKKGMESLSRMTHPAISMLLNGEQVSSRAIGWSVAPLLNTPGRVGRTELAVRFFIEKDREALRSIVSEIRELNDERREFISVFCARVMADIHGGEDTMRGGLVYIKADSIPEGYAGLIANRISDATGKPTIVTVMPPRNGLVKGSGRSRSGIPFFSLVEEFRDRFERIGGHENAFGFTASFDQIDEIINDIGSTIEGFPSVPSEPVIDCEIPVEMIDISFIRQVQLLEPFGNGNSEPIFLTRGLRLSSFIVFGGSHGKFLFPGRSGLTAIGWGMATVMRDFFDSGKQLDLVYRLENNAFNGTVRPRMIIISIHFSSG